MKTIEVQFSESCSERFYLYPTDFDLSLKQFERLETSGIFKFHGSDIEVERQYYTSDEEVEEVIKKIQDGLQDISEQAKKLRESLTLVPCKVTYEFWCTSGVQRSIEKLPF